MSGIGKTGIILATLLAALAAPAANAADARRTPAGTLRDGTAIEAITLSNAHGVSARILSYGATLQSLMAPDRAGKVADVVLGYDDLASYVDHPNFFGVTVGRFANRIAGGRFTLDGKAYQLPLNDKVNSLHGGGKGFDKVAWKVLSIKDGPTATLVLGHRSADGESGYPGNLDVTVTYRLEADGTLAIAYAAVTDRPTILSLTNHSYFNLAGEDAGSALGHMVTLAADAVLETDAEQIPTGRILPVAGTPFDFRTPTALGARIRTAHPQLALAHGYDHTYVLGGDGTLRVVAQAVDPASGRSLTVATTQPGLQLYTANMLDGTVTGAGGGLYRAGDAVCFEAQGFPDAPNHPAFPSTVLRPDAPFRATTTYRFGTVP